MLGARPSKMFLSLASSVIAVAGLAAVPVAASAASAAHAAAAVTPAGTRRICPLPTRVGQMACQAVVPLVKNGRSSVTPATSGGYSPASLRSAYGLTQDAANRGRGETIAVVDAYRDPDAATNLATYRHRYGLPACTTASHCLRILNQEGKTSPLPKANAGWAEEESLDLDMVSAVCPHCHIIFIEAKSAGLGALGRAEDTAVAKGARFVTNSWSGSELRSYLSYNHYFNHPGDVLTFAAGDQAYGTAYPTDLQYVTAVGGTTLRRDSSSKRGWSETVWEGTGSGCSAIAAKPSWQRRPVDIGRNGCPRRTENDVAAIADPDYGVQIYDSYQNSGWFPIGGTSVATPVIAAVYALAGTPARRSYPSSYLYQHLSAFHDVTSGYNGWCPASQSYLCNGAKGYDGPTGLGTPRGASAFSRKGTDPVTVVDPGNKSVTAGKKLTVQLVGLDSRSATAVLHVKASGLPRGLHIKKTSRADAEVTGTVAKSAAVKTYEIVVTARDDTSHKSATTHFTIRVK